MRIASNEIAQRAKLLAYSLLAAFEDKADVEVPLLSIAIIADDYEQLTLEI